MLEDEQINLKRAEERLAAVQAELKALTDKGPPVGEPATEGLRSPPSHTVCLINRQVEQDSTVQYGGVRRASVLEIKRTNLLFLLLYRRRGAG